MMEWIGGTTEYSKIRNIWNIIKTRKKSNILNMQYMEHFKARNIRNILKHGSRGKSFKEGKMEKDDFSIALKT